MKYIIAIIGKAGSGKDTIQNLLCERNNNFSKIVSYTTRPKRENEKDGVDYHYITNDEFCEKVLNGEMLEATYFNNWHYGTSKESLADGINIGVFNPDGYDCLTQMVDKDIKFIGFYIDASDKTRMLRQLNRENNPDVTEIVRRYQADERDFIDIECMPFLFPIDNDNRDIQDVVKEIEFFIQDVVSYN